MKTIAYVNDTASTENKTFFFESPDRFLSQKVIRTLATSLFVFFVCFYAIHSFCQPVQFRFQHFTSENGLPQNTVYGAVQDKYGFMWFSTKNGVCRYDGYDTKVFKPSDVASKDVVDLSQCIELTTEGNIVFGTGSGFYVIDVETDTIKLSVDFSGLDSNNTYLNSVLSIKDDGTYFWIGTGDGLVRYKKITGELMWFKGPDLLPGFASSRFWVKAVELDKEKNIWIASPNGLTKLNTKTFATENFNQTATGKYFTGNTYFSSLSFDNENNLWAGTLKKGVYKINTETYKTDSIPFIYISDSSKTFNEVKRICFDSNGYLWAGTQYTGLVRINTADKKAQYIRSNNLSKFSLASDLISALYCDKNGILWVGTYNNGVDRTNAKGSAFTNIPFAGMDSSCFNIKAVECFAEQDSVHIWVGTMNGLFLFNRLSHQCQTFEEVTQNKIKLPHASVAGVAFDNKNNLWIGTRSAVLSCVNLTSNTVQYFTPDSTDILFRKSNFFSTLIKAYNGRMYFAYDGSLLTLSNTGKLISVIDKDSLITNLKRIERITDDKHGNLFLSSSVSTLHSYNYNTNTLLRIKSYNENKDMLSQNTLMLEQPNGNYILTDYKGLHEMGKQFIFLKNYSDKDGLCDNKITNSHIDVNGRVWVATFNGLSVFSPAEKSFTNFFVQDGLLDNEFREAKSLQAQNGNLFFPTNNGFTYFNPNSINNVITSADIFLTSFKILGKEKFWGNNINATDKIDVPSGSNFFSISFASSAYNTLQPNVFMYMLEGVDKEWVTADKSNVANYTNVDGGSYIFRVKAVGADSKEKTITIIVSTVLYKTAWFRLLLFLLLLFFIYRFIRFREKQLLKKESEKTIDYFANSFYGNNTVDEILWDVCRNCISRLGFEDAVVYLVDEKYKVLVQKAAYGPKNPIDFQIAQPLEIPIGQGIVGTVAYSGKAEIINDTSKDIRYIADDASRLSEIAVPIVFDDKVIGVIDSEHSQKNFFTQEHLRILNTIASICSTKIAKAQSDQEALERERMLLEIGKKVAETRLMALRAQMNPHFIFNSLNSIQDCIVSEQHDKALNYLTQFAKLLRMVIDLSDRNYIPLEKEIDFLKLYLNIESLRFSDSFTFEISMDDELDIEEISIPSLLVQPFAENAIWHGLMHKKGERKLKITFAETEKNHLEIVIEDNGIGRQRAEEIKASKFSGINHESKGMKISEERIALLKLQTDIKPQITIYDLTDMDGLATGTRVVILIPVELTERRAE